MCAAPKGYGCETIFHLALKKDFDLNYSVHEKSEIGYDFLQKRVWILQSRPQLFKKGR